MYVFVEISIDTDHFVPTIELNFPNKSQRYNLFESEILIFHIIVSLLWELSNSILHYSLLKKLLKKRVIPI